MSYTVRILVSINNETRGTGMKTCADGYPGCRTAEATGEWCTDECEAVLRKELDAALIKRDKIHQKHMARYRDGSATRARTTTCNAEVGRVNDLIISLRDRIKQFENRT